MTYEIIDTTLREGEQTPGVLFRPTEKRKILAGLARVGVAEVEIGIASHLHRCTGDLIAHSRRRHPGLRLSLWSRCRKEDIAWAAEKRPDLVSLSIPVSDIHLENRLQKSRDWARLTMCEAIDFSRQRGLAVAVGFEDATRADKAFLACMARTAAERGAVRIRLADTVGIASPGTIAALVRALGREVSCPLAVHAHNDFGMATANAVAGLEAGATAVDTVILGLGERAGCARLEEVAAYLSLITSTYSVKTEHLKPLACLVAAITGRTIEGSRPVIGEDIFTCETGLHLHGLTRDPATYEPYPPERVSGQRRLLIGAKTGRRAIIARLDRDGEDPPISDMVVQLIRDMALSLRRPLNDREIRLLIEEAGNQKPETRGQKPETFAPKTPS